MEHRLIHYRAEDFSKKKPIAATSNVDASKPMGTMKGQTVNTISGGSRGYQAAAAEQEKARQAGLPAIITANQQQQLKEGKNVNETYIDPNTGADVRFVTKEGIDTRTLDRDLRDKDGNIIGNNPDYGVMVNPNAKLFNSNASVPAPTVAAPQQPSNAPTTWTNPNTKQTYTGAAAERGKARYDNLQGTYAQQKDEIDNMKGYKDVPIIDPDTGETTGYTQEYSAEKTQEMQQSALDRLQAQIESDRKQKETERKGSQTATDPTLEGLPEDIQGAYQPGIDAANRAMDRAGEEIDTVYDEMTAEAIDAVTQKKQDEATELQIYQDRLNFNKQRDDLARDRKDESQRRLLAENETAQEMVNLEAKRAERIQRDTNVQSELQNRRLAAKLGINHDTGGLQWMQEEVRKGNETVSYLIQQNALSNKQFSQQRIDIINAYDLDMRQIDLDAKAAYDQAYSAYSSEKSAIKKDYLAGVKDRRTARREAQQRYYDTLTKEDEKKAGAYRDARLKLMDQEDKAADRALEYENRLMAIEERAQNAMDKNEDQSAAAMTLEMNRINTRINNDPILKPYQEQKMKWKMIDADYQRTMDNVERYNNGEINKPTMNLIDQGLINGINKMWDESSVVRESEYARTPAGMSIKNRLESWASNKINGGILNDEERTQVKEAMDAMFDVWTSSANTAMEKFYLQINKTNKKLLPQHWLTPEDFGLDSITDIGTGVDFDNGTIEGWLYGMDGGGGSDTLPEVGATLRSHAIVGTITGYGSEKSAAGVDIAAPKGTPVKAHIGGTIVKVTDSFRESFPNNDAKGRAQNGGYGNQVVMKFDNGYTGLFSHLDRTAVREMEGGRVEAGTVLGFIGNTGNTYGKTGIHLDFELRDSEGNKLSPQQAARFLLSSTTV